MGVRLQQVLDASKACDLEQLCILEVRETLTLPLRLERYQPCAVHDACAERERERENGAALRQLAA